jgi:predicted membrane-bound spermidine synthase
VIRLSRIQKVLSFFIPIKVWKGSSKVNPVLELFFYNREWWLGTADALYSTGTRYKPLLLAFRTVGSDLNNVHRALVLGAGLGSASAILSVMGHYPHTTLVDIDDVVINLARDLMDARLKNNVFYVVENAQVFIQSNQMTYDLLVVDIFNSREVPEFVSEVHFLEACKRSLNRSGYIIANYMIKSAESWTKFQTNFTSVFPSVSMIELGTNRILIAKV